MGYVEGWNVAIEYRWANGGLTVKAMDRPHLPLTWSGVKSR